MKLLAYPKPVHDQLMIELPCLNGFRNREVTTWRAEDIDFQHGDTLVLDAKKHKTFKIPLNSMIAAHAEKLLDGRREGYVIVSTSNRNPGKPLGPMAVWHVWRKWAVKAGLFNWRAFSPIVGRRFFAANWYHRHKLSLMTLCMVMRHANPGMTLEYVNKLIFYEDLKKEFLKFQFSFLQEDLESTPNIDNLHDTVDKVFASLLQQAQPQLRLQISTAKPKVRR